MNTSQNLDPNRFIKIENGNYIIGISKDIIESASSKFNDNEIKKDFLYNSYPEHTIAVEKTNISKYLITLSEFEDFVEETGYQTEAENEGWGWIWEDRWAKKEGVSWKAPFGDESDKIYRENKDISPVLMVSCNDAQAYCNWFSEKVRKISLPSESEWEIFAGITGITGIGEVAINSAREDLGSSIEYIESLLDKIIQTKEFNYPGLIWEWTSNWFDAYPSGVHNKEFGKTYKVLRGGSLVSHPVQRTREYRFRRCPTARSPFYGFRVAAD